MMRAIKEHFGAALLVAATFIGVWVILSCLAVPAGFTDCPNCEIARGKK